MTTTPPAGPRALFLGFLQVGLLGFGGSLPLARRMIIEQERWLTAAEFTELLAVCQFLPGPNLCNMTIALGRRFHGAAGALAAILGLLGAPVVIAIGLGMLQARFGARPVVAHAFLGLAAAGSGMVAATAVKIALPLRGAMRGIAVAAVAFVEIAVLRAPLLILWLVLVGVQLSLVAVGGVTATVPELQRQVVDVHRWMGAAEFGALFGLAQAAPGPNVLVVTLVGWRVAGIPGALAATVAVLVPSGLLTWFVAGLWHRFRDAPWRRAIQAGLVPLTAGLVMAAAATLAAATTDGWRTGLVTAAVAAASLRTRVHPLWLLGAGAVIGALG